MAIKVFKAKVQGAEVAIKVGKKWRSFSAPCDNDGMFDGYRTKHGAVRGAEAMAKHLGIKLAWVE